MLPYVFPLTIFPVYCAVVLQRTQPEIPYRKTKDKEGAYRGSVYSVVRMAQWLRRRFYRWLYCAF